MLKFTLFLQKIPESFQIFAFYHFLSIQSKYFNTKMFQNIYRKHSLFTYCHYKILEWCYRNLKTNPSQSGKSSSIGDIFFCNDCLHKNIF